MKGGNTPVSKSRLVLIFNMIKWEGGTSFFEIMDFFWHSFENGSLCMKKCLSFGYFFINHGQQD